MSIDEVIAFLIFSSFFWPCKAFYPIASKAGLAGLRTGVLTSQFSKLESPNHPPKFSRIESLCLKIFCNFKIYFFLPSKVIPKLVRNIFEDLCKKNAAAVRNVASVVKLNSVDSFGIESFLRC